jgi:transposase-like protein
MRTPDPAPAVRERITAWVALHRERGVWWSELASQIGVPAQTLKRWSAPSSDQPIALRRVEVIAASR